MMFDCAPSSLLDNIHIFNAVWHSHYDKVMQKTAIQTIGKCFYTLLRLENNTLVNLESSYSRFSRNPSFEIFVCIRGSLGWLVSLLSPCVDQAWSLHLKKYHLLIYQLDNGHVSRISYYTAKCFLEGLKHWLQMQNINIYFFFRQKEQLAHWQWHTLIKECQWRRPFQDKKKRCFSCCCFSFKTIHLIGEARTFLWVPFLHQLSVVNSRDRRHNLWTNTPSMKSKNSLQLNWYVMSDGHTLLLWKYASHNTTYQCNKNAIVVPLLPPVEYECE